jgi:hypothetical protein
VSLEVIDGQQRLIALSEFRQDLWPLFTVDDEKVPLPPSIRQGPVPWSGKPFSRLPETEKNRLLDVGLSVVVIDEVTGDEVRDLFIRLQAGTPLTPQQVRDAWPGNVGPFVERLAGKGKRTGTFNLLFEAVDRRGQGGVGEDEYEDPALEARQACAQLLLLLLAKERGRGYPSMRSVALNDLYHENTDFDPQGKTAALFETLLADTMAVVALRPSGGGKKKLRKSQLYSLFLFMRFLRFGPFEVRRVIPEVAKAFWADPGTYGTEPNGRAGSPETLERHFAWFVTELMRDAHLPELDPRRTFEESQRRAIYEASGGKCGICQMAVSEAMAEYDHIKPWILGGRTVAENGRPVHAGCHARGLAAVDGIPAP